MRAFRRSGSVSRRLLLALAMAALFVSALPSAVFAAANANLHLDKTVATVAVTPRITLTMALDRTSAIPGDRITYTATVTNTGADLAIEGDFSAQNTNATAATIASYWDAVSTSDKAHCGAGGSNEGKSDSQWPPFAGAAAAQDGYTPVRAAPIASGMKLDATPVPADGVAYPADPATDLILGTVLQPGATARWHYTATLRLTPDQLGFLRDPSKVTRIRNSFHAEPTPRKQNGNGQPDQINVDFCEAFDAADTTGTAANVRVDFTLPDGSTTTVDATSAPALAGLAPGASATVAATYPVPVPAARAETETVSEYLTRLSIFDNASLHASSAVRVGSAAAVATAGPVATTEHLPILTLAKTGPETVDAGKTAAYDFPLANIGTAPAAGLALVDRLPAGDTVPVTGLPAGLDPAAEATAHAAYDVPIAQPGGPLTDTVALTWQDANGNAYGPIEASATTQVKPRNLVAHLTLTPEAAGPFVVGTQHTLTVTATGADDKPQPNIAVTLTITGPNPATADLVTNGSGQATFTYTGAHEGTDTAQADVKETGPASNTATAIWMVPIIPVTTTTVHGRFFPSKAVYTDDFTATRDMTPLWEQDFPNISFDPVGGKVKNDKSGVGTGTRPFTDVTTDAAGNYTGTIVAEGNGYQAGMGDLVAFDAVFTGQFVIAAEGDYQFDFLADDGFIFGVGGGAVRVDGVDYRCPADRLTVFERYPVMACYQHNTPPLPNKAVVHFPAAGTYPYELDYLEVWSGSLSLSMTLHSTGLQVAPMGSLVLSPQKPADGQRGTPQTFSVAAMGMDGVAVAGLPVTINVKGANLDNITATTDADGIATFSYSAASAGLDTIQAFAYFGDELILSNTVSQNWLTTPPVPFVGDVTPEDGTTITAPTPIKASFTPPPGTQIADWKVEYQREGDSNKVQIGAGVGTPPDTLATFDPTVLINGGYKILITATTDAGTVQTSTLSVVVDGNLKLGRYQVTYQDANVPVGGIPIQVLRTYDSFDKSMGDFGIGWRVSVANFRVYTNGPLGNGGWSQYPTNCIAAGLGGGLCTMAWTTSRPHYVTVVWPDGHQEVFDFTPTGGSNVFWFSSTAFTARPGSTSKLEDGTAGSLVSYNGNGILYAGLNYGGAIYNPTSFKLTAKDGTVYEISTTTGLTRATDRNGNTITISASGVVSSLGPRITFHRDGAGRLYQLDQPDGKTVKYGSDGTGNLTTVTDQLGNVVTLKYDTAANLTDVIDPLGRPFLKVEYENGRVSAITDATHGRTLITSDPGAMQQRVVNAAGTKTTVTTFNADGDVTRIDEMADGKTATTRFEYDANHNVVKRVDPAGYAWLARYDDRGNLTSYTVPGGTPITITYDDYGLPQTWTDSAGGTTTYHWNANGTLQSVTDAGGNDESYEYDGSGNVTRRTDRAGNVWTYTYQQGRVLTVTDPRGKKTSYAYYSTGALKTVTDPLGHATSYEYDATGSLTKTSNALAQATSYTYDELGFLATSKDPAGKVTTYVRDGAGRLLETHDPIGGVTYATYDADGRVKTSKDARGFVTTYDYDGFGNVVATIDSQGVTSRTYDLRGLVTSTTNASGGTTRYEYDATGNITKETDPHGHVTLRTYWPHGEVKTETDALGHTTRYDYDELGLLRAVTDPTGRVTRTNYDALGRTIEMIDPAGAVTRQGYDTAGRQVSVTDPIGHVTQIGYDDAGRRTSVTDPLGHTTSFGYDPAGRLTSETSPAGVATSFTYDPRGLTTSISDVLGHSITRTYDDAGRLATETDQRGYTTSYQFDATGNLASMTDALGHSVSLEYDALGRRTKLTDANGYAWLTSYDALGGVSSTTDPLGRTSHSTFDSAGLLVSSVDARGVETRYGYDDADRLTSRTAGGATIATEYDAAGRRTTLTSPGATVRYGYDRAGRLSSVEQPGGTVGYGYDDAGRRTSMTTPAGTVGYGYDDAGNVTSVSRADLGGFAFRYDPDGRLIGIDRPNGVHTDQQYDGAGRLKSISDKLGTTTLASFSYTLDAAGNRTAVDGTNGHEAYTIDAAGRLTDVAYGDGTSVHFDYDAAGNRTKATSGATSTTYAYDEAGQLVSAGAVSFTYDADGNRTSDGASTFTYDTFGNLATAEKGGTKTTFGYSGDGVLVRSTTGGTTALSLWDINQALPQLLSDGVSSYASAAEQLLATTSGTAQRYPLTDALGSVRAQTDSAGTVTATASYDAFGATRASSGLTGSIGFAGAVTTGPGLVYLQARYLDPVTGTFLSRDPLTPGGRGITGYNPYAYVSQNPTTFTDPSGRGEGMAGYAVAGTVSIISTAALATAGRVIGGLLVLAALMIAVPLVCQHFGCTPWPTLPNLPALPDLPKALEEALSVGQNWTNGFLGEVKVALKLLSLYPGFFLRYHVYFATDYGARFLDICVYPGPTTPKEQALFCVEVKTGRERDSTQKKKDAWIMDHYHFPIYEWDI